MNNILAIAHKELKSYFASPIAYIVIGLFALLYGYFYAMILYYFVRQSMQMNQFGMQGPQAMNILICNHGHRGLWQTIEISCNLRAPVSPTNDPKT